MSNALEIDGKTLHPIKDATQVVSYSRDYVTRLAREQKIKATYVGRQWFVDIDSLKGYEESSALEQELWKKQLSEERKREQELRSATQQSADRQQQRAAALPLQSAVVASLVLSFGVLSGYLTHQLLTFDAPTSPTQVAATGKSQPAESPAQMNGSVQQPTTDREVPIAEPLPPSQSTESLGDVREGVLLFPTATTTPDELFSDNVRIEERADGSEWVYKLNAADQPVGEPIPFVRVPVEDETREY